MNDYNKLTYDELLQINDELRHIIADLKKDNKELTLTINELRTYQQNMEKFTSRVYAPNKSYKDLEEKLAKFEEEKKQQINEILNTTIIPLQNQVKDKNIQLDTAYSIDQNNKNRIKDLERVIEKQNVAIHMAVGYISSMLQFANEHPINVKKWLMGGM